MYTDPTGHCADPATATMCLTLAPTGPLGWIGIGILFVASIAIGVSIGNAISPQVLQHNNDFIGFKENKNLKIKQMINIYNNHNRPSQNQKPPEPPKDKFNWLDEAAKAVRAACVKNWRRCIGTGILGISSTLVGIDVVTGDPNPFHCSSNPSHPACQGATGTPTPTISPTNTLTPSPTNIYTPSPTNTLIPSPTNTSTTTPTNTSTPSPSNTSTPYPISPYYNSPNILMQ